MKLLIWLACWSSFPQAVIGDFAWQLPWESAAGDCPDGLCPLKSPVEQSMESHPRPMRSVLVQPQLRRVPRGFIPRWRR